MTAQTPLCQDHRAAPGSFSPAAGDAGAPRGSVTNLRWTDRMQNPQTVPLQKGNGNQAEKSNHELLSSSGDKRKASKDGRSVETTAESCHQPDPYGSRGTCRRSAPLNTTCLWFCKLPTNSKIQAKCSLRKTCHHFLHQKAPPEAARVLRRDFFHDKDWVRRKPLRHKPFNELLGFVFIGAKQGRKMPVFSWAVFWTYSNYRMFQLIFNVRINATSLFCKGQFPNPVRIFTFMTWNLFSGKVLHALFKIHCFL